VDADSIVPRGKGARTGLREQKGVDAICRHRAPEPLELSKAGQRSRQRTLTEVRLIWICLHPDSIDPSCSAMPAH
jgi:hypothetical protein